jgi:hypothetical protein
VTVLDDAGNPAGHWVSEADGTVSIPRRGGPRLRLRVGLRNEEPIELNTTTLRDGVTDLAAPTQLPPRSERPSERPPRLSVPGRPPESQEIPPHVLYFQRLAMFAEPASAAPVRPGPNMADLLSPPTDQPTGLRYGMLFEVEELWQSLGVSWGELLYSVSLTPGDEAHLAVLDGRWRREAESRERPLQILARMVGTSMLGDLVTTLHPEVQVEPFMLMEPDLTAAAVDSVQMIRERTERMSQALRRRPLGVVDARADTPPGAALRTVRNTTRDRVVTFHFFEPLERFRVVMRSPKIRPVVFVPFHLPNVATADVVRRFGYIIRRTLLDRGLIPDLEELLGGADAPSRLLEHIQANLLYYSSAIISAGDPAARFMALSKLRVPGGVPLTNVVENAVIGRVGNAVALPLNSDALLSPAWREALAAYAAHPARVNEDFAITIPHPGVWTTAQPAEPLEQQGEEEQSAAG